MTPVDHDAWPEECDVDNVTSTDFKLTGARTGPCKRPPAIADANAASISCQSLSVDVTHYVTRHRQMSITAKSSHQKCLSVWMDNFCILDQRYLTVFDDPVHLAYLIKKT